MMKQIFWLFSLLFVFGCSKSDDSNKGKSFDDQLYGKWLLIKEERFEGNKLVETVSLKAAEHCEYDVLDFLPSNSINYLAYYLDLDTDDCNTRYMPDAYRWKMMDHRRLVIDNGEVRQEYIIASIDDAGMILEGTVSRQVPNLVGENGSTTVNMRVRVHYQRVK
ncbi:hypothetical protein [Myroides sp. WP-1]|uniref:hypothetical protein n=1 Tax=Myroides sp. WP-1 TaxID=2759944 RepID=UPI0015FA83FB|nr:hypothetical protein [Myroides sp. WP-1]MBB1138799.1 hypothetical protein [Myroides sp. WP-1]